MNDDRVEGQWQHLRGKLKARWAQLTDDDLQAPADGSPDYLAGKLQERYGIAWGEAKRQINASFDAGSTYPFKQTSGSSQLETLQARQSSSG